MHTHDRVRVWLQDKVCVIILMEGGGGGNKCVTVWGSCEQGCVGLAVHEGVFVCVCPSEGTGGDFHQTPVVF